MTALAPLAACAGQTPTTIAASVVKDISLLSVGFTALLPTLSTVPGVATPILTEIAAYIAKAEVLAQSVSGTITVATAQPIVSQIETYFNEALALLGTVPLPANVTLVINAVKTILPIVEVAVGIATASVAKTGLTPDQARAVLGAA